MTIRTLAIALAVLAGLTACGGPPPADAEDGGGPVPAEASGFDDCLIGTWSLDVEDYGTQSEDWLVGLGIPLDSLEMTGTQVLVITGDDDPLFTLSTNLVTTATVAGNAISVTSQSSGAGAWSLGDDDSVTLSDWAWAVPPGDADPSAPPAAPFIDPESDGPITADCGETTLSLRGADAPLTGNFFRG